MARAGSSPRGSGNPRAAAGALVEAIVQGDVSPAARAKIEAYLAGSDAAMMADPVTMTLASRENIDGRMRGAAYLTMATPAYQLA